MYKITVSAKKRFANFDGEPPSLSVIPQTRASLFKGDLAGKISTDLYLLEIRIRKNGIQLPRNLHAEAAVFTLDGFECIAKGMLNDPGTQTAVC